MLRSSLPSSKGKNRFVSPLLPTVGPLPGKRLEPEPRNDAPSPSTAENDPSVASDEKKNVLIPGPAPPAKSPLLAVPKPKPVVPVPVSSNNGPGGGNKPSGANLVVPQKRPAEDEDSEDVESYFNVLWRKITQKKHKTWDGDGVVVVKGKSYTLKDSEGKEIGKASSGSWGQLKSGETITISGKEVEIVSELEPESYKSGRVFISAVEKEATKAAPAPRQITAYKNPAKNLEGGQVTSMIGEAKPRHNPLAPNALVMPRPDAAHSAANNRKKLPIVDVVVDPVLSSVLRQHQREGVTFLYECAMGMRDFNGQGAILADEMGLGKTLQTISLVWTLLKQNPYYGEGPVARRALIVCPATLVANWTKEFNKWLGKERLRVFPVDGKSNVQDFLIGRIYSVMIIGYEKMRLIADILKPANFDLVICDEGHRLKDPKIKTNQVLNDLSTRRRIILSGTPIQNNLEELFTMIDFANPGVLGAYGTFKQVFEKPILQGRSKNATASEKALAEDRSAELSRLTGLFILRRTAAVNSQYLPPKHTFVLFVKPTRLQATLYNEVIESKLLRRCLEGSNENGHLRAISVLKKIAMCPTLLSSAAADGDEDDNSGSSSDDFFRDLGHAFEELKEVDSFSEDWVKMSSSKLVVFDALVSTIVDTTVEKIVVVSMSTQSLTVCEELCKARGWGTLRLDGSTPTTKRQPIIDKFNDKDSAERVLLLSSKSGGAGLNVVGASRMIFLDLSWNPADDIQAMARCWREGQKRPVHIYRLCMTGTLEENQLQRQSEKSALSTAMMNDASSSKTSKQQKFTPEELRKVFRFNQTTLSSTHDGLRCRCHLKLESEDEDEEDVEESGGPKDEDKLSDLKDEYRHMLLGDSKASGRAKQSIEEDFGDKVLASTIGSSAARSAISAIFANTRNS